MGTDLGDTVIYKKLKDIIDSSEDGLEQATIHKIFRSIDANNWR